MSNNNENNNFNINHESCSIDWTLIPDAIESELYDGHIPETFRLCTNTTTDSDKNGSDSMKQQQQQQQQTLRIYPKYHMNRGEHVHIIDNSVPTTLLTDVYNYTIQYCTTGNNKPAWGSYITMNEIRQHFHHTTSTHDTFENSQIDNNNNNNTNDQDEQEQQQQHNLSLQLALHFFRNAINASSNNNSSNSNNETSNSTTANEQNENDQNTKQTQHQQHKQQQQQQHLLWTIDDMYDNNDIHGIALWGLASTVQTNVPYHIDYAELIRYQYGYIIPPVVGGTLHCTPNIYATIINGDYYVIPYNGLHHYAQYGYKGGLVVNSSSSSSSSCSSNPEQSNKDEEKEDNNNNKKKTQNIDDGAIKVQYQYNRMICQSGHLPHWSTPVTNIINNSSDNNSNNTSCSSKNSDNNNINDNHRRVIVGFNVFLKDIGDEVQKAPEHSDKFRYRVTQLRLQHQQQQNCNAKNKCSTASNSSSSSNSKRGFTIDNVKSNPKLSTLLVHAKRVKNKNDFRIQQEQLDYIIVEYILQHNLTPDTLLHSVSLSLSSLTLLEEIVTKFNCQTTNEQKIWPTIIDVQVHVQHRLSYIRNLYLAKVQSEE